MPMPIPPSPPSFEEWKSRYDAGARTMAELDPAYAKWREEQRRSLAIRWPILIACAVVLGVIFLRALTL